MDSDGKVYTATTHAFKTADDVIFTFDPDAIFDEETEQVYKVLKIAAIDE